MTDDQKDETAAVIAFECDLDEPPEKVWRAISIPEFRKNWLPDEVLADPQPVSVCSDEIRYRMRDEISPFVASVVALRVLPNGNGGTTLRIIHELEAPLRSDRVRTKSFNDNVPHVKLAA